MPGATLRLRTSKRPRLLWQPGQSRCVRGAGRRPLPLFSPPSGPGPAAAVRGGGGVPLPWQGCARRAHSSPGWERPGDTRRGGDGGGRKGSGGVVVEGGSERGRSLGQDEPGLLGAGVGSLESAPHLLALRRRPTPPSPYSTPRTLARVQDPRSRFRSRDPGPPTRRSFSFL